MSRIPKEPRPTPTTTGRIVGPDCRPYFKEDKYPKGRAIAAAYWISYFTLHWLTILDVVERSPIIAGTTGYFILMAIVATLMTIAFEATEEKK